MHKLWFFVLIFLFVALLTSCILKNTALANIARYFCVVGAAGMGIAMWSAGRQKQQGWLAAGLLLSLITDAVLLFAATSRWVPLAVGIFSTVHWCYLHRFVPRVSGWLTMITIMAWITGLIGVFAINTMWLILTAAGYAILLCADYWLTHRHELPNPRATWLARTGITAFVCCDLLVALAAITGINAGLSWYCHWPALVLLTTSGWAD